MLELVHAVELNQIVDMVIFNRGGTVSCTQPASGSQVQPHVASLPSDSANCRLHRAHDASLGGGVRLSQPGAPRDAGSKTCESYSPQESKCHPKERVRARLESPRDEPRVRIPGALLADLPRQVRELVDDMRPLLESGGAAEAKARLGMVLDEGELRPARTKECIPYLIAHLKASLKRTIPLLAQRDAHVAAARARSVSEKKTRPLPWTREVAFKLDFEPDLRPG
jgi:hypothetical protein